MWFLHRDEKEIKENSIYSRLGTGNHATYVHIYYVVMTDSVVRCYFISIFQVSVVNLK